MTGKPKIICLTWKYSKRNYIFQIAYPACHLKVKQRQSKHCGFEIDQIEID